MKALNLQGLPGGGLYWTRTSGPIDVSDVLCLGGKVYRKQMLGVHALRNVDITAFPRFLHHRSGVRRMGVNAILNTGCSRGCSWVFTGRGCSNIGQLMALVPNTALMPSGDLVISLSILSAYLIQCTDEPRNLFNDCESGSKWPQRVSSLKGTCMHRKSASEEALM